jgi:ATP-dependent phosphofructokinase / diphosphate-dependent phosphofructokinase
MRVLCLYLSEPVSSRSGCHSECLPAGRQVAKNLFARDPSVPPLSPRIPQDDTCCRMTHDIRRIGVLTAGGDCPGLNAVIRAVSKTAMFNHGIEVLGIEDGFQGLIDNRMSVLGRDHVSNILAKGGTILGSSNKASPHHYVTGYDSNGKPIVEDVTPRILQHVKDRAIDAIIAIGGDGTMAGAHRLSKAGINVIGVPKTIDNDLMHNDTSFGFQTAVEIATEALDRIHTTAASHHRVMLVETMGRNAGWLALHSGVASGADVILIPEIPYDLETICKFCQDRAGHGKSFTIIAVAEGAHAAGGEVIVERYVKDSPDPIRLGGLSTVLAEQIGDLTGLECRSTILGHVQRGGTPCAFDRVLATVLGHRAIELVAQQQWNRMVAVQSGKISDVQIQDVVGTQRTVPMDCPTIAAARDVETCFGDS